MTSLRTVNVGMIGYGFMGKAHSIGYRDVSVIAPADVPVTMPNGLWRGAPTSRRNLATARSTPT
mgnify:CR=1 FL=1